MAWASASSAVDVLSEGGCSTAPAGAGTKAWLVSGVGVSLVPGVGASTIGAAGTEAGVATGGAAVAGSPDAEGLT